MNTYDKRSEEPYNLLRMRGCKDGKRDGIRR